MFLQTLSKKKTVLKFRVLRLRGFEVEGFVLRSTPTPVLSNNGSGNMKSLGGDALRRAV